MNYEILFNQMRLIKIAYGIGFEVDPRIDQRILVGQPKKESRPVSFLQKFLNFLNK